jgi:hypothetical protein
VATLLRERTPAQQQRVARCHDLGLARLRAAQSVFALDAGPRLTLLRDSATCFIAALLADAGEAIVEDELDAPSAWEKLQRRIDDGAIPQPPPAVLAARPWLASNRPLEAPGAGEASDVLDAAFGAAHWLAGLCDPRVFAVVRGRRKLGLVAFAAALAATLAGLAVIALQPTNLALGKKVQASSQADGNRRPAGLTNGTLELTFGAETKEEDAAWFVVDLGAATAIDRIVVYNRGDHEGDGNVPLELEVGESMDALKSVGTRTEAFSRTDPWVVRGLHRSARYIRVRRTTKGPLLLDEVEVYR